ncbi:hypothetical protein [Undibacterium sp. Xuan67W]|uniref:hypothetical protein n=1 Tax=Undibacterium sp. Xuan67W TaxID=3413057 RepID=UPI003BF1CA99
MLRKQNKQTAGIGQELISRHNTCTEECRTSIRLVWLEQQLNEHKESSVMDERIYTALSDDYAAKPINRAPRK